MKVISLYLVGSICLFLSGCAEMARQNCTPSAAYANGINQAKEGMSMNTDYAGICEYINMPEAQKSQLNKEYAKGYRYGLKYNNKKEIDLNVKSNDNK
ncbi:MAG: hypothetical protein EP298_00070 [Gammaproteobacteria bacterium]|nr:MAG: hypothetical protein EP298_00070 [Gammaproteobacteria bacterium]UTW41588.1 hypothetical protein KFE69_08715 [bacterium SCSIO 12844]